MIAQALLALLIINAYIALILTVAYQIDKHRAASNKFWTTYYSGSLVLVALCIYITITI